jgi:Carbon-nitrogen hydrolase
LLVGHEAIKHGFTDDDVVDVSATESRLELLHDLLAAVDSSRSMPAADLTTRHRVCKLATCNLNQWAMDFAGNLERVERSIQEVRSCQPSCVLLCPSSFLQLEAHNSMTLHQRPPPPQAKAQGAAYRVGPELEIPGYGCEDHFLEPDTVHHSWEALGQLLGNEANHSILVDVGMPVIHRGVRYNCRVFILDGRVLLIRPKLHLADDGNYREGRYFTTWKHAGGVEQHRCGRPRMRLRAHRQHFCPTTQLLSMSRPRIQALAHALACAAYS